MTKIFCALDTQDMARAVSLATLLSPLGIGIKLGLEYYMANGPTGVQSIKNACPNSPIFLDLKFHDIPNTVAQAVRAVTKLGVDYINLHASGGPAMMRMAQEAMMEEAAKLNLPCPKLLAVTILTSLNDDDLAKVGQVEGTSAQVMRLARLTHECGLAGIVCSAHEIAMVRAQLSRDFVLMVPGIRPSASTMNAQSSSTNSTPQDDQKRTMTPAQALDLGATHLVIGRPITAADDPLFAAQEILQTCS